MHICKSKYMYTSIYLYVAIEREVFQTNRMGSEYCLVSFKLFISNDCGRRIWLGSLIVTMHHNTYFHIYFCNSFCHVNFIYFSKNTLANLTWHVNFKKNSSNRNISYWFMERTNLALITLYQIGLRKWQCEIILL